MDKLPDLNFSDYTERIIIKPKHYVKKMRAPLFSIITVARNNLAGLQVTEASLQTQIFQSYEWIVIDGGSTDGTAAYMASKTALWVSEPDQGIYDAMNKGLRRATGNYLLFLNAGDALAAPDTLQKIQGLVEKAQTPPDFIYGDSYERTGEQKYFKPARPARRIAEGLFTHHQAMLYRRTEIDGLIYDTQFEIAADYDFTARFLKQTRLNLYTKFPICIFESGGISQKKVTQGRYEQFIIRQNLALCSPFRNIVIYLTQTANWALRRYMPGLYWHLKSSGNKRRG